MEIKNTDGVIIFYTDNDNIKDAVEEAVKSGADLRDADLRDADLRDADLRRADLSGANLRRVNLSGANLSRANLFRADLSGADLSGADLSGANLRRVNLSGANLFRADLSGADLSGADLSGANLYRANLFRANLGDADLRDADLRDADLSGANLSGADLRRAKNIPYIPIACPTDGDFTGWKKVNGCLIRLLIPSDAKRSSATTNKCRCDKALVLSITNIEETVTYSEVINNNYAETTYKEGEMVYPDSFDDDRWNECSHGIHFFINKQDAINY